MKPGAYENLINKTNNAEIENAESEGMESKKKRIDSAESSKFLAEYLSDILKKKIEEITDSSGIEEVKLRVEYANGILSKLGISDDELIVDEQNYLAEIISKEDAAIRRVTKKELARPLSGYRTSTLFTGGSSSISMYSELIRDIESADKIYIIVSFLRLSGLNLIYDKLKEFCGKEGHELKIITTTYCGITEAKALKRLSELDNTEIKISYNTRIERLHAKSYIFERNSNMSTAYIGSSNLSKAAQSDGLEWNVRVTNVENPQIIKAAIATFERYWNSPDFEDFSIGGIAKFEKELKIASTQDRTSDKDVGFLNVYNILPHQKAIIEKITAEREQGVKRNLVVAATGTGKTVISAFDYKYISEKSHKDCKLLYIAHREEILKQARHTYRGVLQDANFGELWVGRNMPNNLNHLFVSVDMATSNIQTFKDLGRAYFDYIVFDEAHHIEADSYQRLIKLFDPEYLIGLTATPERMDGKSLLPDFCDKISAEIRLPKALEAGLLTPFQYFCISDETDLTDDILWLQGKYVESELTNRLCNEGRAQQIIKALQTYVPNEYKCKALGFCASQKHAKYMSDIFNSVGLKADWLTSERLKEAGGDRNKIKKDLEQGNIHYLFVKDIFNEGVDIPAVDTVLFLRPTESITIFQQQLGRGLRLAPGKTVLTVLDFVAQANKNYDYSQKFQSLMKKYDVNLRDQIKCGFTMLPPGCSIHMEEKAQQEILDHIQSATYDVRKLSRELSLIPEDISLSQFLNRIGQDIRIIYRNNNCWTSIRKRAGKCNYVEDEYTKIYTKGMGRFYYINSQNYISFITEYLNNGCSCRGLSDNKHVLKLMLYYALYQKKLSETGFDTVDDALNKFGEYPDFVEELRELIEYIKDNLTIKTELIDDGHLPDYLEMYGCYSREDIFTIFGKQTEEKRMSGSVAGVYDIKEMNTELFFVTLNKSDKEFSPTTMYDDYVISEHRFHWQSQNNDSHTNKGKRFIDHVKNGKKFLLFVREAKNDGYGNTCPFYCLGYVNYVSSTGDLPMNIEWETEAPIPASFLPVA